MIIVIFIVVAIVNWIFAFYSTVKEAFQKWKERKNNKKIQEAPSLDIKTSAERPGPIKIDSFKNSADEDTTSRALSPSAPLVKKLGGSKRDVFAPSLKVQLTPSAKESITKKRAETREKNIKKNGSGTNYQFSPVVKMEKLHIQRLSGTLSRRKSVAQSPNLQSAQVTKVQVQRFSELPGIADIRNLNSTSGLKLQKGISVQPFNPAPKIKPQVLNNSFLGPGIPANEKGLVNISEKYSKERATSDDEEEEVKIARSSINVIPANQLTEKKPSTTNSANLCGPTLMAAKENTKLKRRNSFRRLFKNQQKSREEDKKTEDGEGEAGIAEVQKSNNKNLLKVSKTKRFKKQATFRTPL